MERLVLAPKLYMELREGVQMKKKTFLNGHCPFRGGGGLPLPGWFGLFFYYIIVLKRGIF